MIRILLLAVVVVGAWAALAPGQIPATTAGAQNPPRVSAASEGPVHVFGKKILYVVTKPRDAGSEAGFAVYEHAEVVRLGTPSFLVGRVPDWGVDEPVNKITKGAAVWTPLSEILQITEFDTLENARQFFELAAEPMVEVEPVPEVPGEPVPAP